MTLTRMVSSGLDDALRPAGFKKKAATWYLQNDEIIALLNLQKSNYDTTYFLNLGFWIRAIEDVEFPKHEQCHVRSRAQTLWPARSPLVANLLSFTQSTDCDENRVADIQTFVNEFIIPFLIQGSTLAGLTELAREHKTLLIRRVAWNALEIDKA